MREMPKDSACLWNTGLFNQMTCWGCHMACVCHSAQDNRAWVHAWFCPLGRRDRVEHACSDSADLSDGTATPPRSVSSTVPFQVFRECDGYPGQEGLRMGCCYYSWETRGSIKGLMIPEWLSQRRTQMSRESGDLCSSSPPTTTTTGICSIRRNSFLHGLYPANHLTRGSQLM